MRIPVIAAMAVALGVAAPASAAVNLINNGSFESGKLAWTYTSSGADVGVGQHPASIITYGVANPYPQGAFGELIPADNSSSSSPDAVGSKGLYFVADASTETLAQQVFLTPGSYKIGFSAYVPRNGWNNSGNASLTAVIAGMTLATFDVDHSTPQRWMNFSGVTDIGTAGTYNTAFTYTSGGRPAGDFVIDRVYVIAVPEPAAWALMIFGFGAAGALLRRRRRVAAAAA